MAHVCPSSSIHCGLTSVLSGLGLVMKRAATGYCLPFKILQRLNDFFEFSASTVSLINFPLKIPLQRFLEFLSLNFYSVIVCGGQSQMVQIMVLCDLGLPLVPEIKISEHKSEKL